MLVKDLRVVCCEMGQDASYPNGCCCGQAGRTDISLVLPARGRDSNMTERSLGCHCRLWLGG